MTRVCTVWQPAWRQVCAHSATITRSSRVQWSSTWSHFQQHYALEKQVASLESHRKRAQDAHQNAVHAQAQDGQPDIYATELQAIESQLSSVRASIDARQRQVSGLNNTNLGEPLHLPALDRKWQGIWEIKSQSASKFKASSLDQESDTKAYILPMFPYPSGNLHMGHMRVYTIADVLSRWKQMSGHDVINPMGWDAFGLPAENAAIERGIDPAAWTRSNIEKMRSLLRQMNTSFDWSRELATCDPDFYRHTQKLFLLMHEKGLAYQAEGLVNWDPVDKTVLANEQVDKDGFSWRSGAKVEQKMLKQWFLKVTDFKEALLEDLNLLARDGKWPERVISQQRNWIGRSSGAKLKFMVGSSQESPFTYRSVEVFTTRPDTLLGVQFLAVSTSHPLVAERLAHDSDLRSYVDKLPDLPEDSKMGYRLKDVIAVNPAITLAKTSPDFQASVPVFVAPYVLDSYGEGAVMGVPGHDLRDNAFWKVNMPNEDVKLVIGPTDGKQDASGDGVFTSAGQTLSNCGRFGGLSSAKAGAQFVTQLALKRLGRASETWRLRDWLISRQRYWGTPIPIIHCTACGPQPVPDDQLPVTLPELSGDHFKGKTGNPLESAEAWVNTTCPSCSGPARRDTDTMDTFVDSSWYFMRFPDAENSEELFSKTVADRILPVDTYVGGVEHAILHLLYARFVAKFLSSIGLWPRGKKLSIRGEPFERLITQGMVHGKTYSDPDTGRFLHPDEVDLTTPAEPTMVGSNRTPSVSYEKMSKSKYNGVDPTALIHQHGADVVRAHTLFSAPVVDVLHWDDSKIVGPSRWLSRVWRHVDAASNRVAPKQASFPSLDVNSLTKDERSSWMAIQGFVADVNGSYSTTSLNTLISDLMKLTSEVTAKPNVSAALEYHRTSILLRTMAPVAPALAEECWQMLHRSAFPEVESIFNQPFPEPDTSLALENQTQTCTVQRNGKLKFTIEIPKTPEDITQVDKWVLEKLKSTEQGGRWYEQKSDWKKVIVVRGGKVVNFVG